MKIVKILLTHSKNMTEEGIKSFIYKNFPTEMITGLEYDDPKTIERALKLLGVEAKGHSHHQENLAKSLEMSGEKEAASA